MHTKSKWKNCNQKVEIEIEMKKIRNQNWIKKLWYFCAFVLERGTREKNSFRKKLLENLKIWFVWLKFWEEWICDRINK